MFHLKTIIPTVLVFHTGIFPAFAHDHLAAGVKDTNNNGKFDIGEPLALLGPDLSARAFHLLARPTGFRPVQRCGGYYMLDESARTLFPNDAFSFTALSDGQEEDASPGHPLTGAYIWMEITAVYGPTGGKFGYWEAGRSTSSETPTVSFEANQPTGDFAFVISTGYDAADQDPFGHTHGRAWTADKPGDYRVSFRFVDRSTTGPGGGPWHAPSEVFTLLFQAGPDFTPSCKFVAGTGCVLTWPSRMGIWAGSQTGVVFTILRSTNPGTDPWTPIGTVTGTTADTATFTDPSPPAGKAFYRLAHDWAGPEEE